MKKKRYIKLLMSSGMSRNDARVCADFVICSNIFTSIMNRKFRQEGEDFRWNYLSYAIEFENYFGGTP